MTCPRLSTELEVLDPGLQPLIVQSQVICPGVAPATPGGVTVGASSDGPSIFSPLQPSQVILDLQRLLGVPGFPHVTKTPSPILPLGSPQSWPKTPLILYGAQRGSTPPNKSLWEDERVHPSPGAASQCDTPRPQVPTALVWVPPPCPQRNCLCIV